MSSPLPPPQDKKGKQRQQVSTPPHFHEGPGSTDGHTGNRRHPHHRSPSRAQGAARAASSTSATPHKHHKHHQKSDLNPPPPPSPYSSPQPQRNSAHAPLSSSKEDAKRRSHLSLEPPPLPSEEATNGLVSLTPKTHRSSSAAVPTSRGRHSSSATPHSSSKQRSPERYSYSSLGHSKRAQRSHRNQDTHHY